MAELRKPRSRKRSVRPDVRVTLAAVKQRQFCGLKTVNYPPPRRFTCSGTSTLIAHKEKLPHYTERFTNKERRRRDSTFMTFFSSEKNFPQSGWSSWFSFMWATISVKLCCGVYLEKKRIKIDGRSRMVNMWFVR